jgi:hypothetical protein
LGKKARNYAEDHFGGDKIMAAWEDLLYGLVYAGGKTGTGNELDADKMSLPGRRM